jgi:hypothetical protein
MFWWHSRRCNWAVTTGNGTDIGCCRRHRLLLLSFSSRYLFRSTSCDPHCSGVKFQTAVLAVLHVKFQVQLSVVVNLLSISLVWLPSVFKPFCYYSGGVRYYRYYQKLYGPHSSCLCTQTPIFNLFSASFCLTFLSARSLSSISMHVISFLLLITIAVLFAVTSLSVYLLIT